MCWFHYSGCGWGRGRPGSAGSGDGIGDGRSSWKSEPWACGRLAWIFERPWDHGPWALDMELQDHGLWAHVPFLCEPSGPSAWACCGPIIPQRDPLIINGVAGCLAALSWSRDLLVHMSPLLCEPLPEAPGAQFPVIYRYGGPTPLLGSMNRKYQVFWGLEGLVTEPPEAVVRSTGAQFTVIYRYTYNSNSMYILLVLCYNVIYIERERKSERLQLATVGSYWQPRYHPVCLLRCQSCQLRLWKRVAYSFESLGKKSEKTAQRRIAP